MDLVLTFDGNWVEKQKAAGVRVTRRIEKWVSSRQDARLKSVRGDTLRVELSSEKDGPGFIAALERLLADEFREDDPRAVFSFHEAGAGTAPRGQERPGGGGAEDKAAQREGGGGVAGGGTPPGNSPPPPDPAAEGTANGEKLSKRVPEDGAPDEDPSAVLERFLGQVPFKHSPELSDYLRETVRVVPVLRRMDALASFWGQHVLLSIDDGYGLTRFLEALSALHAALGLAKFPPSPKACTELKIRVGPHEENRWIDWENAVETARDMRRANERHGAGRTVLCLDIGAWQGAPLQSAAAKGYLRRLNAEAGTFTIVFRIPFVESRCLNSTQAALADILNVRPLVSPPVPLAQLTEYAQTKLAKRAFDLGNDAFPAFERWIIEEKSDDSFFGYRTIDKMVDQIIYDKALSNTRADAKALDMRISASDLDPYAGRPDDGGDPEAELDALVGLDGVKAKVREIVGQIKYQRALSARGRRVKRPSIHMLFTGNPGTGKTTVARLVARILKKEGILRKGHLLEVKGRDFCGEYVGQTAPKTAAICRDAYGSVLFIDEAYSLFRGDRRDPGNRDYGPEALDTLVAEMENHRDDMCVIMAGYTDEMDDMLKGNIGLHDRIPFAIPFPNYGRDDLVRIFAFMAKDSFECDPGLEPALRKFFDAIPDDVFADKEFSNARFVRNLYERTWAKAACRARLAGENDALLLASDLEGAAQENEFKRLVERNERKFHPIGFAAWSKPAAPADT